MRFVGLDVFVVSNRVLIGHGVKQLDCVPVEEEVGDGEDDQPSVERPAIIALGEGLAEYRDDPAGTILSGGQLHAATFINYCLISLQ